MNKNKKDKIQNLVEELIAEAMAGFNAQGANSGRDFASEMGNFATQIQKELNKCGGKKGRCANEETIIIEDETDTASSNVNINVTKNDTETSILTTKLEALETQLQEKDEVIKLLKDQVETLKNIIDSKL